MPGGRSLFTNPPRAARACSAGSSMTLTAPRRVAREALRICHFDPDEGTDLRRGPPAREDCEAACYDCLMSYSNQLDHALLDRQAILPVLLRLSTARSPPAPAGLPARPENMERLLRLAGSTSNATGYAVSTRVTIDFPHQPRVDPACDTRPDFFYADHHAAVYIDGPHHEYPEGQQRDAEAEEPA